MSNLQSTSLVPATVDPDAPQTLGRPSAAVDACLRAIERVEQVVDQETQALRQRQKPRLDDFNRRKSHGLLDLTRAIRPLGSTAAKSLEPRLNSLRTKLRENASVLKMHLEAVQEISAVLAGAIRDGESDGTYSGASRLFAGKR